MPDPQYHISSKEPEPNTGSVSKVPEYDIDEILSRPNRKAYEIVAELGRKIDYFIPETQLLPVEVVIRDLEAFAPFEGEGLHDILQLNSGIRIFLHGLRAFKALNFQNFTNYFEEMRSFLLQKGLHLPEGVPGPSENIAISDSLLAEIKDESKRLDDLFNPFNGLDAGELQEEALEFVKEHLDEFRRRKPTPSA